MGNESSRGKKGIVVVSERRKQDHSVEDEPEMQRLTAIPFQLPLLKHSISNPNPAASSHHVAPLNYKEFLKLSVRYQSHLRQISDECKTKQESLIKSIREEVVPRSIQTDSTSTAVMAQLASWQRRFAKNAEQIEKVQEISSTLNKVKMAMEESIMLMDRLNASLPASLQMAPFALAHPAAAAAATAAAAAATAADSGSGARPHSDALASLYAQRSFGSTASVSLSSSSISSGELHPMVASPGGRRLLPPASLDTAAVTLPAPHF